MNFSPNFNCDQLSTDVDVETVGTGAEVVLSSALHMQGLLPDKLIHDKR